jgi:adenylate kinase family enzyme
MRLFVTGPTGSGKSTLATKIAQRAGLPKFSLDDMHWVRRPSGDKRRDPAERLSMLQTVVQLDGWVIEGVQFKWADIAIERADRIVVLDLPRWRTMMRILRRFSARRLSLKPSSRGTLAALAEEMHWSADYYDHERRMLFEKVGQWSDKLIVVRSRRDEHGLCEALLAAPRSLPRVENA